MRGQGSTPSRLLTLGRHSAGSPTAPPRAPRAPPRPRGPASGTPHRRRTAQGRSSEEQAPPGPACSAVRTRSRLLPWLCGHVADALHHRLSQWKQPSKSAASNSGSRAWANIRVLITLHLPQPADFQGVLVPHGVFSAASRLDARLVQDIRDAGTPDFRAQGVPDFGVAPVQVMTISTTTFRTSWGEVLGSPSLSPSVGMAIPMKFWRPTWRVGAGRSIVCKLHLAGKRGKLPLFMSNLRLTVFSPERLSLLCCAIMTNSSQSSAPTPRSSTNEVPFGANAVSLGLRGSDL